jgi:tryptophan-rich sensory protein
MLGVASVLLLYAHAPLPERRWALIWFYLQLGVNFTWTPVFFGAQNIRLAFWILALLLFLAVVTCGSSFDYGAVRSGDAAHTWLFLVYALLRNFSILRLNAFLIKSRPFLVGAAGFFTEAG